MLFSVVRVVRGAGNELLETAALGDTRPSRVRGDARDARPGIAGGKGEGE